tara:strand:+ start:80 stop:988 length:909 start_codon:yes stop_codon:yes gene_type:complete
MSPLIVGGRTIFGALSSQPTGITTAVGSEYFDTTLDKKRVYKSTGWEDLAGTSASGANIGAAAGTLMYFDFGNYSGSSWQGNTGATNLVNVATSGASGGVNLPKGSSAAFNSSNGGVLRGSGTQDVRTTISGSNPLGQNISMGIVVRFDSGSDNASSPSRGLLYYGNTGGDQHFYVRKNFGVNNNVSVGQDTNGSDTWTEVATNYVSNNGFTVFIFNLASDGTLSTSINGAAFTTNRSAGGAISVSGPNIGFFGDPYNDNSSSFDIGAGFWRTQLTTDTESADWYTYLKSDYGAGSNRFSLS